nr:10489_t:CDS:1 [Entrophospora candida]
MGRPNKRSRQISRLAQARKNRTGQKNSMVASDTHDTSLNTSDIGMDLNEHPSSGIEPKVESKVKAKTESVRSPADNNESCDDLNMNRGDRVVLVREKAKKVLQGNTIPIKSRSFYLKESKRTQQRRAKKLRDAAVGTSKITKFFNIQTSSEEDQSEI